MKKYILACFFLLLSASSVFAQMPERLYARERAWVSPANQEVLSSRVPVFLWPAEAKAGVSYTIRVSKDSLFKKGITQETDGLAWAMHVVHQGLEPGNWYWQYGIKNAGTTDWSPVNSFVIPNNAQQKTTKTLDAFLRATNKPHPRLWVEPTALTGLRERNKTNPEALKLLKEADKLIGKPLPKETPTRVRDTAGMSELDKKLTIEFMYHGFGQRVGTPLEKLCVAYMLSDDAKYAREGIKQALHLASMDPAGFATRDDFNSGNVMEAMALAYDRFYDLLTPEERKTLLDAIRFRGDHFYAHMVNNFETYICDNHVWQHILRNFTIAAFATVHDLPEASTWLSYAYEVWSARFPVLGTTDGGWFEGNGYFPVHFKTLIYLPMLFQQFEGTNYFQEEWFQSLPTYMLYSFPPNSYSISLGDKHEDLNSPLKTWTTFAYSLAKEIENPDFVRYVHRITDDRPDLVSNDANFLLHRILRYDGSKQEVNHSGDYTAIERSKLFPDIGLAVAHSDLNNSANNLMVSLSASPFGASGHAHASQNSLTINYKGQRVIGGSGYYTNFSDHHNLLHYRNSRGYSTILADSIGQSISEYGYGYLEKFLTGNRVSYFSGDASNAYSGKLSAFWIDRFDRRKIPITEENGIGDAKVKTFKRHVLTVDSNLVIIYDELEAEVPRSWTWQMHSPLQISAAPNGKNSFAIGLPKNDEAIFTIFATGALRDTVHSSFNHPAVNWKGKEDKNGNVAVYQDEWHAGVNSSKANKMRFLTVVYLGEKGTQVVKPVQVGKSQWRLGALRLSAEMDTRKAASIRLEAADKSLVFTSSADGAELTENAHGEARAYKDINALPAILK